MFEFQNNVTPPEFEYWKAETFHFCIQDANIEALVEKIVAHGGKRRMPIREYYPGEQPYKMANALQHRPDLLAFEAARHTLQQQVRAQKGAYAPQIAVVAGMPN